MNCGKIAIITTARDTGTPGPEDGGLEVKIAVLSDTHGLLRQEVLDHLSSADAILHGGDINNAGILKTLSSIAPVYVVRGNNDKEWAADIPPFLDFEIGGIRVCMTHKKRELPADLSIYDLAVFGHSHRYEEQRVGNAVLLNPGSCGPRRFNQAITMAMVTLIPAAQAAGKPRIEITRIDIPNATPTRKAPVTDLKTQIGIVMRETERGTPALTIAARRGWDAALVEQIARLYVTHPGVTADGIMTKLGV